MPTPTALIRTLARPVAINCLVFTLLLACAAVARAQQEATPRRGFQPGGSYAIGDIETVNTTNGNVMLRLPLASLPAGRGGFSGPGVTLSYNSKLWDTRVEYRNVPVLGGDIQPDPNDPHSNPQYQRVPVSLLQESDGGGWRLGLTYQLQLTDRDEQYSPEPSPCTLDASYRWKLRVIFPDGGAHDMAPAGYTDYQNNGYYQIDPNGRYEYRAPDGGGNCYYTSSQASTSGVWYWSTDGSNVRLYVGYDGDGYWQNNPWTLYLPDGGRVTGGNSPQRFYDRNENYAEVRSVTLADGRPATRLVDQLERYVQIDHDLYLPHTYVRVKGANATELVWTIVWKDVYVQKRYKVADLTYSLPPETHYHSLWVVDRVILPNPQGAAARFYEFGYNASSTQPAPESYTVGWGEISSVKLPTDASSAYQWRQDGPQPIMPSWSDVLANALGQKTLTYQREYDGQSSPTTETWTYNFNNTSSLITGPDGGMSTETFGDLNFPTDADSGRTYYSGRPDGSVVERIWLTRSLVKTEFTSIRDAAGNLVKTAVRDYEYDCYGNVTRAAEYDWVPFASVPRNSGGRATGLPPAQPKRVTTSAYYHTCQGAVPRIMGALKSREVSEGAAVLSRTEFFYDDPLNRGNLTEQRSWDSAKGAYSNPLTAANSVSVSHEYDDNTQTPSLRYGNRTMTTDARGVQTRFVYGPVGGHSGLYPTETRAADNHPSLRRTAQSQYDFLTGLATRVTDADNNVAAATSYDAFGRPVLSCAADNVPASRACTATEYSDYYRRVIVRKDLNAAQDGKLVSVEHYDQLGRVRLSRQLEDSAAQSATNEEHGVKVQSRYAYSGQNSYQLVSNPYRAAHSHQAGAEGTMGWSLTKSDRGGRVVEARTFNGASLPAPWGTNASSSGAITTSYDAEFTTVTDQAGKPRRTVTDGLGQLARVDEPDGGGSLGPAASPVQPTHYTYDALGNLKQVAQGAQARTFVYSSLSRLTSATNPESGAASYTYDANGNLKTRTDARGVSVTYDYDELNRNTLVNYSDTAVNPDIRRYYDNAAAGAYGKGRFYYDCKGGDCSAATDLEHRAVDSYDAMGRPLVQRQHFKPGGVWSAPYQTSRQYNRAGGVVSQTYPSGHAVSYNYDASGRLADLNGQAAFSGNLGDGVARTYSAGISYDEAGRMREERFGTQTPLYHKLHYNARGQLYDVRLSTIGWATNDWDWNRGVLAIYYGAAHGQTGANNNGNVSRTEHWIPTDPNSPYGTGGQGPWAIYATDYQYDALNRLDYASEARMASGAATTTSYTQGYTYDRWGNRQIDAGRTSDWVNERQFGLEEAAGKNRLLAPGDAQLPEAQRRMRYDAAGNLTYDSYTGAGGRTYDAESRMISGWGDDPVTGPFNNRYAYDADGRRVRRVTNAGEVWLVYGIDGELLAEYAASAAPTQPRKEYGYRGGELLVTAEAGAATPSGGSPYGGAAAAVPGTVEIERYDEGGQGVGYYDTTPGSHGQDYDQSGYPVPSFRQPTDVDVYKSAGYSGSYLIVGQAGDWLNYTVDISTAGTYTLATRVAWGNAVGGTFRVEVDGVDKTGPIQIPDTGWTLQTITKAGVQLPAGRHVLRVVWETNAANGCTGDIDYLNFTLESASGGAPTAGLVGHWKFDEGAGATAADSSGNGLTGTMYGASWAAGHPGSASGFDGVDDFVGMGAPAGLVAGSSFSASAWIYPTGPGSMAHYGGIILSKEGEYELARFQDGTIQWAVANANPGWNWINTGAVAPLNQWTHVAFVYNGATAKTYVNGSLAHEQAVSGAIGDVDGSQNEFRVGGRQCCSQHFAGRIDEARFYNRALTSGEAAQVSGAGGGSGSGGGGAGGGAAQVRWLVRDHLGTPRMTADLSGSLAGVSRHDYLPFGEEIGESVGGRTAAQGYSGDGVRQKFTGYEQDGETGLDFAQARYYASRQGRFTSPDPLQASASLTSPQSWNRYAYVLNNPLVYVDPTGEIWIASGDASNPYRWVDECPTGGTCYESVGAVVNIEDTDYAVVYGSNNAQDITAFAPNEHGMIDLSFFDDHHNAHFEVRDGSENTERYTNAETAVALFNATRDYAGQYPDDDDLVITATTLVDGTGSAAHPSSHGSPNTAIDFRYMNDQGRALQGNTAAANADANRMSYLFGAFRNHGINQTVSGRPADFGTGPVQRANETRQQRARRQALINAHQNHGHAGIVARLR